MCRAPWERRKLRTAGQVRAGKQWLIKVLVRIYVYLRLLDRTTIRPVEHEMNKVFLAVLLSLGFASQAEAKTQYKIQPQASDEQPVHWQNGIQSVDDVKPNSVVRLISVQDELPDKQSTFRIIVLNRSDQAITFGPENVSIEYADGEVVAMATHEELEGKLRRDIKRRQALAALGAAFSAGSANGYTTGSVDYSGTTNYGTNFSGSGSYSTYDPALALQQQRAVQAQAAATSQAIQARQLSGAQALQSLVRTSTIQPGETFGGIVAYVAPKSFKRMSDTDLITIVIKLDDEEHRISAQVSETK
jgi:hypothetical protein